MKFLIKLISIFLLITISYVNSQLSQNEKNLILSYHTKWRSNPNGPTPVSPISTIVYNETIASALQLNLRKCDDSYSSMYKYAQNSEWQTWVTPTTSFNLTSILVNIEESSKYYDWSIAGCSNFSSSNCEIWTNAVWNKSISFGCAKSICDDTIELSCSYYPAGGFKGVLPYKPTSKTPSASTVPKMPNLSSGSVDWSDYQTPVRDQGECKSCWVFGSLAALESRYLIKNGVSEKSSLQLSAQNAMNCITSGCNSGWPANVFDYFESSGISFEKDYPYDAIGSDNCTSSSNRFEFSGYDTVENNKNSLIEELKNGPITISLYSDTAFQSYAGGIYDSVETYTDVNHVVLLVGYDKPTDSWKIKNSLGTKWGELGYARISASNDKLGILLYNSYFPKI
ncbi:hypothetical protein RB653_008425 [Dictyostelium firmibasis]|uniref:Uncharacterized protein n=1 Tax=Dictyostelium firmibasis TaxID=79012 RepID=A0AAN7YWK9_9MYCE